MYILHEKQPHVNTFLKKFPIYFSHIPQPTIQEAFHTAVGSFRLRQLPRPHFQSFRNLRLIAAVSCNEVSLITLLVSVQTKKDGEQHVPNENLECSLAS